MELTVFQHRLLNVLQFNSPNHDQRPNETNIKLIVIHGISLPPGEFNHNYVHDLFMNQLNIELHPYFQQISGLKVSSHLYIRRTGEIQQFVPFHLRAWHAGISCYLGEERCNDFSIGIELEGSDDCAYEHAQYESLMSAIQALFEAYPQTQNNPIIGHEHISPKRKTDPGPYFDWSRLQRAGMRTFS